MTPTQPVPTTSVDIAGYAARALASLTPSQIQFIQSIPKAELHAHLNGSIPIHILQELAEEYVSAHSHSTTPNANPGNVDSKSDWGSATTTPVAPDHILQGIRTLAEGASLETIDDFFGLFGAIYALTSTPDALARATRGVLEVFLGPPPASESTRTLSASGSTTDSDSDHRPSLTSSSTSTAYATYLELRTTPRQTPSMSRHAYIHTVLSQMVQGGYTPSQTNLIISLDRKMGKEVMNEILTIVEGFRGQGDNKNRIDDYDYELGKRIVGIDLCGDPTAGDVDDFKPFIERAKKMGLGVTLHIAETTRNTPEETLKLLSYEPDRLGHATFLDETATSIVLEKKMCIEICLSSNLLCKTVTDLETHHIHQYLKSNHPISICTDDILPFRTSILGEYALLLAERPLGLGLSEDDVRRIGEMSLNARFYQG